MRFKVGTAVLLVDRVHPSLRAFTVNLRLYRKPFSVVRLCQFGVLKFSIYLMLCLSLGMDMASYHCAHKTLRTGVMKREVIEHFGSGPLAECVDNFARPRGLSRNTALRVLFEAASQHCVLKVIFGKPFLACPLYSIRHSNLALAQVDLAHRELLQTFEVFRIAVTGRSPQSFPRHRGPCPPALLWRCRPPTEHSLRRHEGRRRHHQLHRIHFLIQTQFDNLEFRRLLRAGCVRYAHCRAC
jgi:hypothetical protein